MPSKFAKIIIFSILIFLFARVRQNVTPLIHITHLTLHDCQEHAAVSGNDVAFGGSGD